MLHRAVGQSPGITLHTGRQPARQLEGKGLTIIALSGGSSHYYHVILTSAHFKTISRQLPKTPHLLNVRVLQQIAGVTEQGQRIHRQVTVTAAETLPALGLINSDDLGAQRAYGSEEESKLS